MEQVIRVPKCCPHGSAYAWSNKTWGCYQEEAEWPNLTFHSRTCDDPPRVIPAVLRPVAESCRSYVLKTTQDIFCLLDSGQLLFDGKHEESDEYCLDYPQNISYPRFYVCFKKDSTEKDNETFQTIMTVVILISAVFLLLTFLVYVALPDLTNIYGKTVLCHVISLLGAFVSASIWRLGWRIVTEVTCHVVGIFNHFFFLSAFAWLTVMCFDMWWNIGRLQPPLEGHLRRNRMFYYYCITAWGGTVVIVAAAVAINYTTEPGTTTAGMLRPQYGEPTCGLNGRYGNLIYFYGPVSMLLTANGVWFVLTARVIYRTELETRSMYRQGDNYRHVRTRQKSRFVLYIKLFLIMGLSWIMEVVSWACQSLLGVPDYYFYATDIINSLQGLFIFIVFVCKAKVLMGIRSRCGWLRNKMPKSSVLSGFRISVSRKSSSGNVTVVTTMGGDNRSA